MDPQLITSFVVAVPVTLAFFTVPVWLVVVVRRRVPNRRAGERAKVAEGAPEHGHRSYTGSIGGFERQVADALSHGLSPREYFIFSDVLLPARGGESTQVDHVVVSKYGVFVIESKDFKGYIWGHVKSDHWVQTLSWYHRYQILNPLRQNWGHVLAVRSLLPFAKEQVHSVVVFSDRCTFKSARINNVKHLSELVDYVKEFREPVLDEEQVALAVGKLARASQSGEFTREGHVASVRARRAAKVAAKV